MKYLLLYIITILLLINVASSAPPFVTTGTTEGLALNMPIDEVVKLKSGYDVNVHVFNVTTGMPVYASTIGCNFHLYNRSGDHIFASNMSRDPITEHGVTNEWTIRINNSNLTTKGFYTALIQCNNSVLGGAVQSSFQVNPTGDIIDTPKAWMYILVFAFALIILSAFIFLAIAIPYENSRDEMTGYIIALSNLKYVKIFCWAITYLIIYFLAYYIYIISYSYLYMDFMTQIFYILFIAMSVIILPAFILFVYLLIANAVRDSQIGDMLQRGLPIK